MKWIVSRFFDLLAVETRIYTAARNVVCICFLVIARGEIAERDSQNEGYFDRPNSCPNTVPKNWAFWDN